MTGDAFAASLERCGLAPEECEAKARLFETAAGGPGAAGRDANCAWWVPGRLELFGKHTDYAGGRSLLAALPRGFVFVSAPRLDDQLRVVDAATGETVRIGTGTPHESGWMRYAAVVVSRLSRNFPGAAGGLTVSFASDLPRAAGMSSSSALVVGIALALIRHWGLTERTEWQQNIRDRTALASYLACVENGSDFGELTGDPGVGTKGGAEDHTAMLLGQAAHFSECSFVPVRHLRNVSVPADWAIVIATSGVRAEKTGAARHVYNQLSETASALLRLWNSNHSPEVSLSAVLDSSKDARRQLADLILRTPGDHFSAETLTRRLDHLVLENHCVRCAAQALDNGDWHAVGEISRASQLGAEDLLRQQVPETVALVAEARASGAFAASSFGAGFGGSVWALVRAERTYAFMEEWRARYFRRFPECDAAVFLAPPAPAVLELPVR